MKFVGNFTRNSFLIRKERKKLDKKKDILGTPLHFAQCSGRKNVLSQDVVGELDALDLSMLNPHVLLI